MIPAFSQARISPAVEDALGRAMLVEARGSGHRGTYFVPPRSLDGPSTAIIERRKRVLQLVNSGMTQPAVASALGVKISTVQNDLFVIRYKPNWGAKDAQQ